MRHILPLIILPALAFAAEGTVLRQLDFNDGKLPVGVSDNTYKGDKPTLGVVDASDEKRGKELSVQVAPLGFAQLFLGAVKLEAGATYKATATMSALADAKVNFYLRMSGKPYTTFLTTTATVGTTPATVTLSGISKEACDTAQLMFFTDAQTTVRIDDVRLEKLAP